MHILVAPRLYIFSLDICTAYCSRRKYGRRLRKCDLVSAHSEHITLTMDHEGNAQRLNHAEIAEALNKQKANRGHGVSNKKRLESLVCKRCDNPKIDTRYFPGTESEPYWTGQKNWISPRNYWSVNFMTGHTFGRFFPNQRLLAMIVQDNK